MANPFTSAGLAAKITSLYALTDDALLAEATLVSADFVSWLSTNFILNSDQTDYLIQVPEKTLFVWGNLYAAALVTRGSITMATPVSNPAPRRTKETRQNIIGSLSYDDESQTSTGSITIDVDWELL